MKLPVQDYIACLLRSVLSHLKIKQPYLKYLPSELRLGDGLRGGGGGREGINPLCVLFQQL